MAQLRYQKDAFEQLQAQVVLAGLGSVEETASLKKRFDVPFAMLAYPEKQLFGAVRLKRASTGSMLSAGMVAKGLKVMAKGHSIGIPKGDVRQLPGVFIIDTDGRIRFSHYAAGPADHPKPEILLEKLRSDVTVSG